MLYARVIGVVIGILLAAGTICACGLFDQDDNDDEKVSKDTVLTEETLVEEIIVEEIQVQEIQIK